MSNNKNILIQELMQIRFLKGGIPEIERYEEILDTLSMSKDISIIKGLCSVIEDDVYQASATEYLLEVIISIIESVNIQEGIKIIIQQTPSILKRASEWAIILHAWILRKNELVPYYIDAIRNLNEEEYLIMTKLLSQVKEECGQDEMIDKILGELD